MGEVSSKWSYTLSVSFQTDRRPERKKAAESATGDNGVLQVPETQTSARVQLPFTEDGATKKGQELTLSHGGFPLK